MATLGGGDLLARPPEGYREGLDGWSSHALSDDAQAMLPHSYLLHSVPLGPHPSKQRGLPLPLRMKAVSISRERFVLKLMALMQMGSIFKERGNSKF